MRFSRTLIPLLCALLLAAQNAGIAHALWHAANRLPSQQQVGADRPERPQPVELSKVCALDLAFGQVLGVAGPRSHSLPAQRAPAESFLHDERLLAPVTLVAPLCRGPPALL